MSASIQNVAVNKEFQLSDLLLQYCAKLSNANVIQRILIIFDDI